MEKLVLKKKNENRIRKGHLWVFSNELVEIPMLESGSVIELFDSPGHSYGFGFYNPHSLIAVRLLKTYEQINDEFFIERIISANDLRKHIYPNENSYRLVFGESDFLPGLIIDKYEDYFAMQVLSAGMEKSKQMIINALLKLFPETKVIIQKNNSRLREMEGLTGDDEIAYGVVPEAIHTSESGIKLNVSLAEGQKTGLFLDQKENRLAVRRLSKGMKVLDCFTNQGGFAMNAANGGAESVTAVDYSESAINAAKSNAEINNMDIEFVVGDVFDYLAQSISEGRLWDMIILDPPAFTKSKKNLDKAIAGYARLNKLAIKALAPGGFLATSSCSQHLPEADFSRIVTTECTKMGIIPHIVYRGMQSPDHPILPSMPETQYLKFFIFKV